MNQPLRPIRYVLPADPIDMGGFPVKQALPTRIVDQHDPFLLLHHAQIQFHDGQSAKSQGVGPHPHRGFSPVTLIIEGEVHHRDSRGNSQIAKAGEVQWMNAGMGIIHSERPSEELVARNGHQEIIQLWVNSPAAKKMLPPEYQFGTIESMPVIVSEDEKVHTKLISGSYDESTGPIQAQSPVRLLWSTAKAGGQTTLTIPQGHNALLYNIRGTVRITGHGLVEPEHLIVFGDSGHQVEISIPEGGQFLLMSGAPLNEPVSQYGPFVMNTQTEIMEAMRDYQMGKMGILIEE